MIHVQIRHVSLDIVRIMLHIAESGIHDNGTEIITPELKRFLHCNCIDCLSFLLGLSPKVGMKCSMDQSPCLFNTNTLFWRTGRWKGRREMTLKTDKATTVIHKWTAGC